MTKKMFDGGLGYVNKGVNKKNYNNYIQDKLVELKKVVAGNNGLNDGYIVVEDDWGIIHCKIAQDSFDKIQERSKTKTVSNQESTWAGHMIDSRMKHELEDKNTFKKKLIVLEQARLVTFKNIDGEKIRIFECNYIRNVVNPFKVVKGLFTLKSYYNVNTETYDGSAVLNWDRHRIAFDSKEKIDEFKKKIEENNNKNVTGTEFVPYGFQLVTLVKNPKYVEGSKDVKERPFMPIHLSIPFDILKVESETAEKGYEYLNIDSEFFESKMNDYRDFIIENYKDEYSAEDLIFEVSPYKVYPIASKFNKIKVKKEHETLPLYKMMTTKTGMVEGASLEETLTGVNWGGECIMIIAPDKTEKTYDDLGNSTVSERKVNLVSQLFVNGYKSNIHSLIYSDCPINPNIEGDDRDKELLSCSVSLPPYIYMIKDDTQNKEKNMEKDYHADANVHYDEDAEHVDSNSQEKKPVQAKQVKPAPVVVDDVDDDIPF